MVNSSARQCGRACGMHSLSALLLASAIAYANARPPDPTAGSGYVRLEPTHQRVALPSAREYLGGYLLPRYLVPRYLGYDDSPLMPMPPPPPPASDNDWLNKEIDRISQMEDEDDSINAYDGDNIPSWMDQERYVQPYYEGPLQEYSPYSAPVKDNWENKEVLERTDVLPDPKTMAIPDPQLQTKRNSAEQEKSNDEQRKAFALTPLDKGYYDDDVKGKSSTPVSKVVKEMDPPVFVGPPRQTRQNPNLSRTKTLVAENLDRLRAGLANKDYRLPVSLLPTNLRWLKINHLDDDDEQERSHDDDTTDKPRHVHVLEAATDPSSSIYGVAMIAAFATAITMAIFGFVIGWYTLSKKAKAAADVDYPAYGVTGPTVESSGDRKLAHSAHMYHYQHQKQQIIAMERNGLEQRTGSISEPESEEENEEGDYTVYECPGFATTGEMEVRNPLFNEDPTPTPGNCEITKPQPPPQPQTQPKE